MITKSRICDARAKRYILIDARWVNLISFHSGTYVKTKKREVEPTRRQAAVHTGMKELAFIESAPLAGILSSARSSESRRRRRPRQTPHAGARLSACLCGQRPASTRERKGERNPVKAEKSRQRQQRALPHPDCPCRLHRTDAASGLSPKVELYSTNHVKT